MTQSNDEFLVKLRAAFKIEAAEHLQAITSGLMELERAHDAARRQEIIAAVFREAHSLKGAARAANAAQIEMVCQQLESVFALWRRNGTAPSAEHLDPLHAAVNIVAALLAWMSGDGVASPPDDVDAIIAKLEALQSVSAGVAPVPVPSPLVEQTAPAPVPAAMSTFDTIRISTPKLDSVLRQAEEMLAVKLTVNQRAADIREIQNLMADSDGQVESQRVLEDKVAMLVRATDHDRRSVATLVDNLLEDSKKLLMLPFSALFESFPKLVRDLSRDQGKEIDLVIRGGEIEIDKRILEEMKDPLSHLLRNSVDHGIERPEVRQQHNKPPRGTITLAVSHPEADKIEIEFADDGNGLDTKQLRAAAVRHGMLAESAAQKLSEADAAGLAFRPEISTKSTVTEISGRGLGLAIVKERVDKLGGQIELQTKAGAGTSFHLKLPVTLAALRGILVETAGQQFVLPVPNVQRVMRVARKEIKKVENRETILLGGRPIAMVRLDRVLGLPSANSKDQPDFIPVVVLATGQEHVAFAVGEIVCEQEVLLKRLAKPLVRVRNVAAATVLGSGKAVVVLNAQDLMKSAIGLADAPVAAADDGGARNAAAILVVEDSITSRMLLKSILESAGYGVKTAVDGLDAFAKLRTEHFDLVVSDVEMPRMNGIELTAKIRADQKLSELPLILVTALATDEDRARGVDVGANAYIVKSRFDQSDLLAAVRRLL